jgi:hypothetical protein
MGTGDSGLFWRQCFALSLALGSWDFYARDEIIRDALRVEAIYQVYASVCDMTRVLIQPINTWMAYFKTRCIINNLTRLLLADIAPL